MERGSLQARHERLTQLVPAIGPVSFARDRLLPVVPALEPLLPDAGLTRGCTIGCQGATAVSVALAVVAGASAAGSWLAVVGLPALGLRAADELGVALERLVMVADTGNTGNTGNTAETAWANMAAALVDGFDLVVIRNNSNIRAATARRLQARVQSRGAVLVVVGDPGRFTCDLLVTAQAGTWEGLGDGSGRLARRRLTVSVSGRRMARERQTELWLPGTNGGIETVQPSTVSSSTVSSSTVLSSTVLSSTVSSSTVSLQQTG